MIDRGASLSGGRYRANSRASTGKRGLPQARKLGQRGLKHVKRLGQRGLPQAKSLGQRGLKHAKRLCQRGLEQARRLGETAAAAPDWKNYKQLSERLVSLCNHERVIYGPPETPSNITAHYGIEAFNGALS